MDLKRTVTNTWRETLFVSLQPVFLFSGIVILIALILVHILRGGAPFSHTMIILALGLGCLAGVLILAGLLAGTAGGMKLMARLAGIPAGEAMQLRQGGARQVWQGILISLLFVTVFFAFLDEKLAVFHLDATRYYTDTHEYLQVGSYSLGDIHFWAGLRSFGLPLFYKTVEYNLSNYQDQGNMNRVSQDQWNLSVVCWTIFALAACLALKNWPSRLITFSIILMLSASVDITFWDRPLLTESLAISFFVLLMAMVILGGSFMERARSLPAWAQILAVLANLLVAVLYAGIRDTNAYFLLFLGGFMLAGLAFSSLRKAPLLPAYLAIAVGFLAIFWLANSSANMGKRYVPPMLHVFAYRFIPEPQSRAYFVSRGMPFDARIASLDQLTLHELNSNLVTDPSILRLIAWLGQDGEHLTFQYLVIHPAYFLLAPLQDTQSIVNGTFAVYRLNLSATPARIRWLSFLTYLRSPWLPLLCLCLALLSAGLIFKKSNRGRIIWIVVVSLFLTAYPLAVLGWHGDTNDIERHSVQVAIQLRLAVWLLLGLLVERGVVLLRRFMPPREGQQSEE